MADIPALKRAPESSMQAPPLAPTDRDRQPLSASELKSEMESNASAGYSNAAYSMFKDAYSQLAKESPRRAASFVNGVESHLSADHLDTRIAAQWALERMGSAPLNTTITRTELSAILSDKKADPFTKAMAGDLNKNLAAINPSQEGGFLGFGTHPAESASKLDLERLIDYTDHRQQALAMGIELLSGKDNVFDQVARNAHKNPNDPRQALTLQDFQDFADRKKIPDTAANLVHQVIDRWSLVSVNMLAYHFDGEAFLSKHSIVETLSKIDSDFR